MKTSPRLLGAALAAAFSFGPVARAEEALIPRNTVVTCVGQADFKSSDTETTFILNQLVTVEGTGLKMNCDRLEIIALRPVKQLKELADKKVADADKFKSLVATGRVRIEQDGRIATCGRAEILPGENLILLTENPMVQDGENTVTGDKIKLLKDQRQAIVEGPVHIELPPLKPLGAKKDPAAAAKPAPEKKP